MIAEPIELAELEREIAELQRQIDGYNLLVQNLTLTLEWRRVELRVERDVLPNLARNIKPEMRHK